ncbi:uncharacterized protein KIAA1143 homolog [Colias croceus]|uniref:uncharacterized protein KIAA1143 homolog n=1 Tax=Colias crocea TaxID=72248 RepID=UPI001E27AEA1|nr:uncharacterized protein KIAA1143 homolog [Colias croceus]XP_045495147.1 uncharacterized protein KIAA1143 homolog [Colias croceus]
MNRKRNVNFIKPDDPPFLKALKKQAGYDDRNHKFDELQNNDEDFVNDDDTELPQVVVLKKGDLTAEEAEIEEEKLKKIESETKADLNQRVIFKNKRKVSEAGKKGSEDKSKSKKSKQLLSFADEDVDD